MRRAMFAAISAPCCLLMAAPARAEGFAEGTIGIGFVQTVDTKTGTLTIPPDTATGHGEIDFNDPLVVGLEVGMDQHSFRVGASYDYLDTNVRKVRLTGTINGIPESISVPRSDLDVDDAKVNLLAVNGYWTPELATNIRGLAGIGIGEAIITHASTELAFVATLGAHMAISSNAYLGLRYRYVRASGPKDEDDIHYNPVNAHLVSAVLGVHF
jgi:opacity protein-like surface antigen